MALKKVNAALALLTIAGMLTHVIYNIYAYMTFFYDPLLKQLTAYPFLICVCLHALLGIFIVVTQGDGTGIKYYKKQNLSTIIQRISAALMLLLLIVHIRMFDLMGYAAGQGKWWLWWLLVFGEALFFAAVIAHISVSFSKALITMGWLDSMEIKKRIDRMAYILGAVIFVLASYVVIKGQIGIFIMAGK